MKLKKLKEKKKKGRGGGGDSRQLRQSGILYVELS